MAQTAAKKRAVGGRDRRFQLRATGEQEQLIKAAAERTGVSVTEFILKQACEAAEMALAERRSFEVEGAAWGRFLEKLERPARRHERLAQLFAEPHGIEE